MCVSDLIVQRFHRNPRLQCPLLLSKLLGVLETKRVNERLIQDVCLESVHSNIREMRDSKNLLMSYSFLKKDFNLMFKSGKGFRLYRNDLVEIEMDHLVLNQGFCLLKMIERLG